MTAGVPRMKAGEQRIFVLLILLGIVLRLWDLGGPSLWTDEAATLLHIDTTETPSRLIDIEYTDQPFLYHVLIYFWNGLLVQGFGLTEPASYWKDFGLRLFPALCSIATLPLVFALARRLSGSVAMALGALFVFSINPFQIYYAQELRVYSFHVLCGLGAIYFFWRALHEDRWRWWLGLILCEALLVYGHYISVLVVFTLNLCFVLLWNWHGRLLFKWTAWQGLMMLLITPALYHLILVNQTIEDWEFIWYPHPTARTLFITYKNFFAAYGYEPMAYRLLLVAAAGLMLVAAASLRRHPKALLLLAISTFLPVLMNWTIWRLRDFPMYEDRTLIFSGAVAVMFAGMGLGALPGRWLRLSAVAVFTALTIPHLLAYYEGELHPIEVHRLAVCDKVDFRSATHYLESEWEEGDLLAHDSFFTVYAMRIYFDGPQAHLGPTGLDAVTYARAFGYVGLLRRFGSLPMLAEDAVEGHDRVWLIEAFGVTVDAQPQSIPVYDWLDARFDLVETQEFDGVKLYLFERDGGRG